MEIIILIVLGLSFGSFVNALVWRMHEQASEKKQRELSIISGRSMCPNCHHELAARDLVPLFSWISLSGKCRYCRKRISRAYPIVELTTAVSFVLSYAYWPYGFNHQGVVLFIFWLTLLVGFGALALYDMKWYILPNRLIYPLIGIVAIQTLYLMSEGAGTELLQEAFLGILVGGGIFYVLFQVSGGKWIGGGDVKLGALAGFLLGGPLNSFLMLFIASALGSIASLPLIITGKAKRSTRLPFGPFLILATVIVYIFGMSLIDWYKRQVLQI